MLDHHDAAGKREFAGKFDLMIVDMFAELRSPRHDDRRLARAKSMDHGTSASVENDDLGLADGGFESRQVKKRDACAFNAGEGGVSMLNHYRLGQCVGNRGHRIDEPGEWLMGIANRNERTQMRSPPYLPFGKCRSRSGH